MKRQRTTSLEFDQYAFHESARKKGKKTRTIVLDFLDHVEESLSNRGEETCIDKLKLCVSFNRLNRDEGDAHLERWLNYAVNNEAKEISLSYLTNNLHRKGWPYVLPQSLYQSSTLETLNLFGCQFLRPRLDSGIRLSLRKLSLTRVFIDQETLQILVSSCRFLEEICIDSCKGFDAARVSGDKLEVVDLYLERDKSQIVAVMAPNLRRLSYAGGFESVRDSFLASGAFDSVKELMFHDVFLEQGFLEVLEDFPSLDKLKFERCGKGLDSLELDSTQISRYGSKLHTFLH